MYQFDMKPPGLRSRFVTGIVLALAAVLGACGGGSDTAGPTGSVSVRGVVTFDFVPVVPGPAPSGGLDYAGTVARPARGVTVEFDDGAAVVASAVTDATGAYALSVPAGRTGRLRVRAEMLASGVPSWQFRVVDNTSGNALYALEGASFGTGSSDSVRDLHAASGWTGAGYGAPRAAAPFAILDAVRDGVDRVLDVDPDVVLPPLDIHWSPDNIPSPVAGIPDLAAGEIVSTFYSFSLGAMYVLGAEDNDTDEYDRHVILHEFGHYLEDTLARSDSVGGPHAFGDALDMRVAFSEGWSNAFAAIATGQSVYRDALGPGQANAWDFDVEGGPVFLTNALPGFFSEQSVHEILYDIFDPAVDGADSLAAGFDALLSALTGSHATAEPLTSLFSFIAAFKAARPADAPLVDAIATAQSVTPVADAFGSAETNDADAAFEQDVLPVYETLVVDGAPVNVCSTDEFESTTSGLVNKLATRRFLTFDIPAAGTTTLTAVATAVPAGQHADPDLVLHSNGVFAVAEAAPDNACSDVAAGAWQPGNCRESLTLTLAAGQYVLEVYEYTNTRSSLDPTPPIGRTCFDVSVLQP